MGKKRQYREKKADNLPETDNHQPAIYTLLEDEKKDIAFALLRYGEDLEDTFRAEYLAHRVGVLSEYQRFIKQGETIDRILSYLDEHEDENPGQAALVKRFLCCIAKYKLVK